MPHEIMPRSLCPQCLCRGKDTASDNLVHYFSGSFCFACGYRKENIIENNNSVKVQVYVKESKPLIPGIFINIKERGLSEQDCTFFNVRIGLYKGKQVFIFPYYSNDHVVRQKIKFRSSKIFFTTGDCSCLELFGQHLFNSSNELPLLITEGEFDAVALYKMVGLPTVSIMNGAQAAYKECLRHIDWLNQWKQVVLCFDNDYVGLAASEKCKKIFNNCKVVTFDLKDANEMLLAGRKDEVRRIIYSLFT